MCLICTRADVWPSTVLRRSTVCIRIERASNRRVTDIHSGKTAHSVLTRPTTYPRRQRVAAPSGGKYRGRTVPWPSQTLLTRAVAGGGGSWLPPPPPLRFFCDNSRTAARSAAKFSVPFGLFIAHVVWNFWPPDPKVRSPGQVKWPNLRKNWLSVISTVSNRWSWNLQKCRMWSVAISCISRIFLNLTWGSGQVGQVYHYSQWGK